MPRFFLLRLQHAQLPLRVVQPEEIRLVSVLKATGLVEADIDPALDPSGTYAPSSLAVVTCITEDGQAELETMISVRKRHRYG